MPLHLLPCNALPGHHQGHALCFGTLPLTHGFTFQDTGPTSAYPGRYPWPWLLRASSSPVAYGWHLLREVTCFTEGHWGLLRSQFPLFASLGRCFPPGLSAVHAGQISRAAGAVSCAILAPARQPLALGQLSRWLSHTFAYAAHRCLLDGIPGLRLPGSAVYPRFRPLRTSRGSGGDAVTPAPRGRGLHPHGN